MTLVRETIMLFTTLFTLFEEKRKRVLLSCVCLSLSLSLGCRDRHSSTVCVVLCWWGHSSRKEMHVAVDHSGGGPRGPTQRRRLDSLPELTVGPLNQCHCECE